MLRRGKTGDIAFRLTMFATCGEHAKYHVAPYSKVTTSKAGRCR